MRPRDCESRRANHETTSKGHFASSKIARRHSESASTRTISAEGSLRRLRRIRTAPHREHVDTHDPRRGFIRAPQKRKKNNLELLHLGNADPRRRSRRHRKNAKPPKKNFEFLHLDHADPRRRSRWQIRNRKKASSFCTLTTPIPAETQNTLEFLYLDRVVRADQKSQKTSSFCTSTPTPAEGSSAHRKRAKSLEFLHLDHPDPRRGSRGQIRNRKKILEFLHLDHADPRRGLRGQIRNRKNLEFLHLDHAGSQTRSTIQVLPRRSRKLSLPYIATNAEAICTWLYALGSMHLALCTWLYALGSMHLALCTALCTALGSMHLALCTRLCALGSMRTWLSMHLALCTRLYAPGSVHSALCTWLCALGSMHSALCTRLCALGSMRTWLYALGSMHGSMHCTWLYALGSMHSALCTRLYAHLALFALGSMHLALCTWLYARLYALGSMHLALCIWLCASDSMQVGPRAPRGTALRDAFGKKKYQRS